MTQQVDLARWEGWRTEARDRHGRWTRVALGMQDITSQDRARGNASLDGFRPLTFASDADAAGYLRRNAPRLPAAQRDAVSRYAEDGFLRLNRALRAGNATDPEVRRLDAALRPSPGDLIVTRHVDSLGDPTELAGKKITDRAYASAALGSPYAGGLGGVTLHIAVPKGTPVINAAAVSSNAHEREVILGRGTSIAVSRVVPNARYGYDAYAVILPAVPGSLDLAQPAPPSQQPPPQGQQPPPPPQTDLDDPALAVAVAAVLAGALGPAVTVAAVVASLKVRFALTAGAVTALGAVLNVAMAHPPPVTGVIGAASEQTSRMNAARRAQYVIAAAKRVVGAVVEARSKGEPVGAAIRAQLAKERRFYEQHQAAMWNRAAAAGKTDMAAMEHGNLLGWNAVLDSRTSTACRIADGRNYYASRMPDIGFPGSTHPACRCFPGPAHKGASLLPSRGKRFARAA